MRWRHGIDGRRLYVVRAIHNRMTLDTRGSVHVRVIVVARSVAMKRGRLFVCCVLTASSTGLFVLGTFGCGESRRFVAVDNSASGGASVAHRLHGLV